MDLLKLNAIRLLNDMPEEMVKKVISYIAYINGNIRSDGFTDIEQASVSSTDFWDNPIDDDIWNNV